MKYMGSKARIAKHILPIILEKRKDGQFYVEPFVGGANLIDKVDGNRIGSDINKYLISALEKIRDEPNELPANKTEANEDLYKRAKNGLFSQGLKGYYGFALSYGGKWFGGWRRDKEGKRDYVAEAYRNAVKQSPFLKGISFKKDSYDELLIPNNSIIYCDPPYEGTTKYKDKFNHDLFWSWCREMTRKGHSVFISEYNAPSDFKCIWEKDITSSLTKNTGSKRATEKLFKWEAELAHGKEVWND